MVLHNLSDPCVRSMDCRGYLEEDPADAGHLLAAERVVGPDAHNDPGTCFELLRSFGEYNSRPSHFGRGPHSRCCRNRDVEDKTAHVEATLEGSCRLVGCVVAGRGLSGLQGSCTGNQLRFGALPPGIDQIRSGLLSDSRHCQSLLSVRLLECSIPTRGTPRKWSVGRNRISVIQRGDSRFGSRGSHKPPGESPLELGNFYAVVRLECHLHAHGGDGR